MKLRHCIIFDPRHTVFHGLWTAGSLRSNLEINPRDKEVEYFLCGFTGEDAILAGKCTKELWEKNGVAPLIEARKKKVRQSFRERKGAKQALQQLNSRGHTIGFITNIGEPWAIYLGKTFPDYGSLVQYGAVSYKMHVVLPDPRAFDDIQEQVSVSEDDTTFVTEIPYIAAAARKRGYHVLEMQQLINALAVPQHRQTGVLA